MPNSTKRTAHPPQTVSSTIGKLLQEADLVSSTEIEVALKAQLKDDRPRLGEILSSQGCLKQETADFFVEQWPRLLMSRQKRPLGYYLRAAGLLDETQIKAILKEQDKIGVKFGSVAVLRGWLKPKTIEFFLKYLAPEEKTGSAFIGKRIGSLSKKKRISELSDRSLAQEQATNLYQREKQPKDNFIWIG